MKDRARRFGESGGHEIVRALQGAAPEAKFHLMGHSFGCIAVSAAVVGGAGSTALPRKVESVLLVQGALSLWSVGSDIPYAPGQSGYFRRLLDLVSGPIITTRSDKDFAVGRFYPIGARIKKQLLLDPPKLPAYGGVGAFGLQGLPVAPRDVSIQSAAFAYAFEPGAVCNLDASRVIALLDGPGGAHSDIAHPEVAHLQWEAVRATA